MNKLYLATEVKITIPKIWGKAGKGQPSHILSPAGLFLSDVLHLTSAFPSPGPSLLLFVPGVTALSIVSAKSWLKKSTLRAIKRVFQMQPDWSLCSDGAFWPNNKELLSFPIEWQLNSFLQHTEVYLLIYCNCLDALKISSFSCFLLTFGWDIRGKARVPLHHILIHWKDEVRPQAQH